MGADRREDQRRVWADLCASLADRADQAADIFEALADFHCRVAALPWHPLASTALERARQELSFAKKEREVSAQLRGGTVGAGTLRLGAAEVR